MRRSPKPWFRLARLLPLLLAGGASHLFGYALENENPWPAGTTIQLELQLGDAPAPAITGTLTDGSTSWNQVALAALNDWNQYLASVQLSGVMNSTAPKGQENGYNNVFFSSTLYGESWGGDTIAETLIWTLNKTPVECDVLFNTAEQWDSYRGNTHFSGGTPINDLKRTALHEFGHVLGLDHPDTAGQTVNAIMNSHLSDTDDLAADDIAGVESLYGTNIPIYIPQVIQQPASQVVYASTSVTFSVSATSKLQTNLNYQWQKDGVNIPGATGYTFTITNVQSSDAGDYTVIINNASGSVTSASAVLTVEIPVAPQITTQPASQTVEVGAGVTFVATASGTAPLRYQWRKNGINIYGATSATFTLRSVLAGDAGNYTVAVNNIGGGTISSAALLTVTGGPAPTYTMTDLGTLGGDTSTGSGLNAFGQVVGESNTSSGLYHPFLYSQGTMQDLGTLPGSSISGAIGINDHDYIMGYCMTNVDTEEHVFSYDNGVMQDLGSLTGFTVSEPTGLNNAGQIVGNTQDYLDANSYKDAFSYTNGVMTDLKPVIGVFATAEAINDSGLIVGSHYAGVTGTGQAYIDNNGKVQDLGVLPGGNNSGAWGINAAGQVVGQGETGTGVAHAFLYSNGMMTDLGTPPGAIGSVAKSINNKGQIVGWSYASNSDDTMRAFLYTPDNGMIDLNDVVNLVSQTPGIELLNTAVGINDSGQILINATYYNGPTYNPVTHAVLLTPIGTPLTLPNAVVASVGQSVVLRLSATGANYQWLHNGTPIAGADGPTLELNNVTSTDAGGYTCTLTNGSSSVTSIGSLLTVTNSTDPGHLVNLSIRANAGSGDQTLIAGFVVSGSGGEPLLIRATGPALTAFGVTGVLADPVLNVYEGSADIATNDNWGGNAQITGIDQAVGAFPLTDSASKDAAIYNPSLPAGVYTAQVTGNGGGTGIALAEIYDATPSGSFNQGSPRLINVSARAQVGTGANILIAGFVIGGTTPKTVLIRAIGPALTAQGVSGVLADPYLRLYSGSNQIAANDNWGGDAQITAVSKTVGAFALTDPNSKDAALLVTLPPGAYTAQVSGADGGTGVALVEVYDVP